MPDNRTDNSSSRSDIYRFFVDKILDLNEKQIQAIETLKTETSTCHSDVVSKIESLKSTLGTKTEAVGDKVTDNSTKIDNMTRRILILVLILTLIIAAFAGINIIGDLGIFARFLG